DDAPRPPFIIRAPDAGLFGIERRRRGRGTRRRRWTRARRWRGRCAGHGRRRRLPADDRLFAACALTCTDFDLRIDRVRVRVRHVETDATENFLRRQAVAFKSLPSLAPIGRLPETAARAAAVEAPRGAAALIGCGVERLVICGIDHEVCEACVIVNELDVRPSLAAVNCLVDAALFVW